MSQSNSSVIITPGVGISVATETIGGKQHQVTVEADAAGHIIGTLPAYVYATPAAVVDASKLYFDIFNAVGSGKILDIQGVWCIPKTDVAVVGALGVRVDLYRTSAAGTGGTVASYKSATIDASGGNICPMDTDNAALPAGITARWLPTAGATISEWMIPSYALGEESPTSLAYLTQFQNLIPPMPRRQRFALREGQGLLVKQGAVASIGSIGFLISFTAE